MEDGPPYSDKITRVPSYSFSLIMRCRLRGYHPVSQNFPELSPNAKLAYNPVSLAATTGISVDFSSSGYLDVSVPRFASCCYVFTTRYVLMHVGFPIRKSQSHRFLLPSLGLSQVNTSFIASDCQGIHRVRLVT